MKKIFLATVLTCLAQAFVVSIAQADGFGFNLDCPAFSFINANNQCEQFAPAVRGASRRGFNVSDLIASTPQHLANQSGALHCVAFAYYNPLSGECEFAQ